LYERDGAGAPARRDACRRLAVPGFAAVECVDRPCRGFHLRGTSSAPGNAAGRYSHRHRCPTAKLDPSLAGLRVPWPLPRAQQCWERCGAGCRSQVSAELWVSVRPGCPEPCGAEAGIVSEVAQALKPFPESSCTNTARTKELKSEGKLPGRRAENRGAAAEDEDGAGGCPWSSPGLPSTRGSGPSARLPLQIRQMQGEGGRAFSQGPCGKSQTSCRGSPTGRLMTSPREPVRRHKTRQFAPEIGEEM